MGEPRRAGTENLVAGRYEGFWREGGPTSVVKGLLRKKKKKDERYMGLGVADRMWKPSITSNLRKTRWIPSSLDREHREQESCRWVRAQRARE